MRLRGTQSVNKSSRWVVGCAVAIVACGARSELSQPEARAVRTDAAIDVTVRDVAAVDVVADDAGPLCGCPGTPGYQRCVLPRMCCPATRTCEDPARFSCTGSAPACPPPPGCAPQDARFDRTIPSAFAPAYRYRWTGLSCLFMQFTTSRGADGRPVSPPVTCVGADCASLAASEDECVARHAMCGAAVETPQRGVAFVGAPAPGVPCGPETCAPPQECEFGVVPTCRAPRPAPAGVEVPGRLRCDDARDCAGGARCCVGESGAYVTAACDAACPFARAACSTDADCARGLRCCTALARYPATISSVGVCTAHACERQVVPGESVAPSR